MEKINVDRIVEMASEGLCDRCLGRLFGRGGTGLTNAERGRALKIAFTLVLEEVIESGVKGDRRDKILQVLRRLPPSHYYEAEGTCRVCGGLMDSLEKMVDLVVKSAGDLEFETFQIGSRVSEEIREREEEIWRKYGLKTPERVGKEINREVGKRFSKRTGAEYSTDKPDVVFILDTEFFSVERVISPLFIRGRYRKLKRGIPQTRWPHRACGGRGCPECNFTGKQYPISVEEIVGEVMKEAAEAVNYKLHGMGREDVDALMLGSGRPFVMELVSPKKRRLDLKRLEEEINRRSRGVVEVLGLEYSSREEVWRYKSARGRKTYRVRIRSQRGEIPEEKLKKVLSLLPSSPIRQRTPTRVAHRRADKVRVRRVYSAEVEEVKGAEATIKIIGEGGLYIKELVHGDDGRTDPSIASELSMPLEVLELDVLDVEAEENKEE